MSEYEFLMIVLTVIRFIYQILSDLLHRRNKESEEKK